MKKIYLFITIAISISTNVFSQDFEFENKSVNAFEEDSVVWRSCLELNFEEIENPIRETILHGDTLIDNVKWRIFNDSGIKGLIRTENDKVIFSPYPGLENGVIGESVIYDFSLEIGDVFKIEDIAFACQVVQIDSIELNDGQMHKKLYFDNNYSYVEGLGSDVCEPFFMVRTSSPTMPNTSTFVCCHIGDELLYMNPDYSDCHGNKVSNEIVNNDLLKVNVTFIDETLYIALENNNLFNVNAFNMSGMLVAQKNKNYYETSISLKGMAKGVYVIQVISGNSISTSKIIKK